MVTVVNTAEIEQAISDLAAREQQLRDQGPELFGRSRLEDGDLTKHELSRVNGNGHVHKINVEELTHSCVEPIHVAYDFVIEQLECLKNEIQSDITAMTASRDAVSCTFKQFIQNASSIIEKIEPRKELLTQLRHSKPV